MAPAAGGFIAPVMIATASDIENSLGLMIAMRLPIVLISHNMPHVFEVADRIHVARLGKRAAVLNPTKISKSDTVAEMTGAMTADQLPAEAHA